MSDEVGRREVDVERVCRIWEEGEAFSDGYRDELRRIRQKILRSVLEAALRGDGRAIQWLEDKGLLTFDFRDRYDLDQI